MFLKEIIVVVMLLSTPSVFASDFSYTTASVVYNTGELDGVDLSGSTFEGSVAIASHFFIPGYYQQLEADDFNADADRLSLGLGMHFSLTETIDLVSAISYQANELVGEDLNGFELYLGFRSRSSEKIEWGAQWIYEDLDDDNGSDVGMSLSARFLVTDTISIGISHRAVNELNLTNIAFSLGF